mgnify:CR=1 FL=1|jgi:hypothetical protein
MKIKYTLFSLLSVLLMLSCSKYGADTTFNPNSGVSGSTARMIVVGDYMYVVDNESLKAFDITTPSNPVSKSVTTVGFGIETIFPFANYLFIGSTDGMYIYSINNPATPVLASSGIVEHFRSCDPVVANSNYAYVTLNTLNIECGNAIIVNELQIVDVQDILHPQVVNKMPLAGPKGLGIDGANLFICEKDLGVLIFDLSDPVVPVIIDTLTGFVANDLIPDNGNLMVVCEDGLRQFDYTNINNISLISYLDLND